MRKFFLPILLVLLVGTAHAQDFIDERVIPSEITRDNEINPSGTTNEVCITGTPGPTFTVALCSTIDLSAKTVTLPSNSVGSDQIGTAAVGANELQDDAVPTRVIQDNAVTPGKVDLTGTFPWTGPHSFSGKFTLSGTINGVLSGSSTNNWAPTGIATANGIRASSSEVHTVTGIMAGVAGGVLPVCNVGSFDIILAAQSGASTAANRFAIGTNLTLDPDICVTLQYDGTSSRWRALASGLVSGGGGGGAWDNITSPGGGQSLSMAAHTTTWTWGATTGASNLFTLTDSENNTGTGYLVSAITQSGSTLKPFRAVGPNGGMTIDADGLVTFTGSTNGISHGDLDSLNQNHHDTVYPLITSSSGAPSPGAVASPVHLYFDTGQSPPEPFYGVGVDNNFNPFANLGDTHNESNNGVHSAIATRSEALRRAGMNGVIPREVFNKTATFTNQPANDGVQAVSDSASDTQACTIYGTLSGGNERTVVSEALTLNGTTPVTTSRSNWNDVLGIRCASAAVGTITFREDSGDQTITTIAPDGTWAAHIDLIIYGLADSIVTKSITFRIGSDSGSVLADTDDEATVWRNNIAPMHITSVWCESDAGSPSINIQKDDGTATNILSSNLTCTTSGASSTSFVSGEDAVAVGDKIDFSMVTAGGVAKRVSVNIQAVLD